MARPLTEADLDRRIEANRIAGHLLPDILLSTGAMTGPHRRTRALTRWTALRFQLGILMDTLVRNIKNGKTHERT
jgi:hypothetical protein